MTSFSAAISGINAATARFAVSANNRANISTTGFKKSRVNLTSVNYDNGVLTSSIQRINSPGSMLLTNQPLDMAIDGNGFFQISLDSNTTAYTRDGTFRVDNQGRIVTSGGKPLSPEVTVPLETEEISIDANGNINGLIGGSWQNLGQIQLANFSNQGGLDSIGNNLFMETFESGAPITGTPGTGGLGTIIQGTLETSNVNIAEEVVGDIVTKTMMGANINTIRAEEEMLGALIDVFT